MAPVTTPRERGDGAPTDRAKSGSPRGEGHRPLATSCEDLVAGRRTFLSVGKARRSSGQRDGKRL